MLDTKKYGSAPVVGREAEPDGFGEIEHSSNTSEPNREQERLAAELAAVRKHLELRGEANAVIAEWRDELRIRIRRTNLKAELIGLHPEEYDTILAEVADYKRLCHALKWTGRRRP